MSSIQEAVRDADFIQECATENYAIKIKLMNKISNFAKPNAIISSSSSGLLPTKIYSKCKNPSRTIIGHPLIPFIYVLELKLLLEKKQKKKF